MLLMGSVEALQLSGHADHYLFVKSITIVVHEPVDAALGSDGIVGKARDYITSFVQQKNRLLITHIPAELQLSMF